MKKFQNVKIMVAFVIMICFFSVFWIKQRKDADLYRMATEGYTAHVREEDTLPPANGTSYYQYQWGLKNDGTIQRITSVYRSNFQTMILGRENGWEIQPGGGQEGSQSSGTDNQEIGPGNQIEQKEIGPGVGLDQEAEAEAGTNDSGWGNLWQVQQQITDSIAGVDIGIEPAWEVYHQIGERRQVTVAIIDTGIDITHPELQNAIWVNEDEIPGDGIDNDNNGYVDDINGWNFYSDNNQVFTGAEDDHGTHGAGTIAAAWDGQGIMGIADSNYVKIMVLKVLGSQEGTGISANVKRAIQYAQDNGADICSLSMGSLTYDRELDEMIRNSPMLFIASAGNGDLWGEGYNIDLFPVYPAAYFSNNIISVGNLIFNGNLDESSNYGLFSVDIAAPGTYILSTVPGGYAFMSGTSMSVPMVTGTAALVYSCRTDLNLMEVKQAIMSSARPVESMVGRTATGGMLNAYGAIMYRK